MKVQDLIHHLESNYQLGDNIVVTWFDKEYVTDPISPALLTDKEIVEQAWQEVVDECQESLNGVCEFTAVGYDMTELFEEKLTELLQKEEN